MSRKILFMAALVAFSTICAIGQSANQVSPVPANGPFGGPILVTPTATLPTPAPTTGISDTGRAGFNSMTTGAVPPIEPGAYSTNPVNAGADSGGSPTVPSAEQPTNDIAPSISINNGPESPAPAAYTVVEASGRYKAGNASHNARVLSNEDVESMLSKKGGVTMAKNMPPLGPGAIEQSWTATKCRRWRAKPGPARSAKPTEQSLSEQGTECPGNTDSRRSERRNRRQQRNNAPDQSEPAIE